MVLLLTPNSGLCPCCSGKSYKGCCQPLHNGDLTASSAEQLVRSRYSAFCMGDSDYLISTLHVDFRLSKDEVVLRRTIEETQWQGLKIIQHAPGIDTATVEFIAFYGDHPVEQLHELSRFVKQKEQWLYTDGDYLAPVKLNRNEICFCGSARKYKKCHGKPL